MVAVGTELLLGQVIDSNSAWIGEALASAGVDSYFQTKVGDNRERIVLALRTALSRSEAVIVCGGLGPTQDDITREALAETMNVGLVRHDDLLESIRGLFGERGRLMAESNARQADVPDGATPIPQVVGTAPGLICPVGHKVVYAVPGVPDEMREMVRRAVIPDLAARSPASAVIGSRVLRTWGLAESTLAEVLAPRFDALDASGGNPTIAFLASGIEGIKVRITAKAADNEAVSFVLDAEEKQVRDLLGTTVFGVDDETMEHSVGALLGSAGLTLGLAESVTGGLAASRLVSVPGASAWFRGSVVAYGATVKHAVLGVPDGPLVSEATALAMAEGARRVLDADVGLGVTGVAGPEEHDGAAVGTVWCGLAGPGRGVDALRMQLPGDRERVRQLATIATLDRLRLRLQGA